MGLCDGQFSVNVIVSQSMQIELYFSPPWTEFSLSVPIILSLEFGLELHYWLS